MAQITVLSAGTWGVALAKLLNDNEHQLMVWSKFPEETKALSETRRHKSLPKLVLDDKIRFTSDLKEACEFGQVWVMAAPSPFIRSTAEAVKPYVKKGQIIVNVSKGIEEHSLMTMSQIISSICPEADVAVLSGPSHAEEVSMGLPTTCVVGASTQKTAEYLQGLFMSPVFRVYTSPDILGIELGAALKNVIALAAGIADGLGYGDNTKAALITRGIQEISRLGVAMGGNPLTFQGLSGIGDLIVTCASMHSRNRRAGILIGKGYTMEQAMEEVQMVVEGVYSAKAALALSRKYQIPLPIIEQVNLILFEGKSPKEAVNDLMLRDKRIEHSDISWQV